jgi:predicted anti-sigma-YlaC factor YlaD
MTCDDRRAQLALWVDGEREAGDLAGLFAHLETCGGCRSFLEAQLAFRGAVQRDRERLALEAAEALPDRAPTGVPAWPQRPEPRREPARAPWLAWALPLPAAAALAVVLLAGGMALGAALGARHGGAPAVERVGAPPSPVAHVIYVCSMPEVRVEASPLPRQ